MRIRHRVDDNQRDIVNALRGVGCSTLSLAALGHDAPDQLVFDPRGPAWYLLEIKNPQRGHHPAEQHDDWPARTGFPVAVVKTVAEALAVVGVTVLER